MERIAKILAMALVVLLGFYLVAGEAKKTKKGNTKMNMKAKLTEAEWKKILTPEQYRVLREKGTERPHIGEYVHEKRKGSYHCAGCGLELFKSDTKYNSGSGWPSFFKPSSAAAIKEIEDRSHGMIRTELVCKACDGHLGHVFKDGPRPTGLRYCVNSVSLKFKELAKDKK